ncbi:tetratricopeptide repeat protein [Tunicatimonas pelagia]|uniref:tetratricopeptide repeat protein n=1 Tax=Tunicatimonas pelagia TaxID=931531 RepID=UPI002666B995|nr:tetratricopeptide repeat protein [Tunicatimonas pelagia]WKN44544.1 tetratricopeptide repeat protein [Tunicatimonas pelagia]
MAKKQLIVVVVAVLVIVALFSLPRIVVDNDEQAVSEPSSPVAETEEDVHLPPLAPAVQVEADSLRTLYLANESTEKNAIFANSLVELFARADRYDSASYYAEVVANQTGALEDQQKAGEMYYEAFMRAISNGQRQQLGEKVRFYFDKVIEADPDDLDAKAKSAMTYIGSSNPMAGIRMLREIVDTNENHELATYNLGLLSMQSGQYQKAVERFEKVKEINPDNLQAQFLLGVSYLEAGENEKSREQLEYVKTISDDPEVIANVDNYLERI